MRIIYLKEFLYWGSSQLDAAMQAHGVQYMMVSEYQLPTDPSDPRLCKLFEASPGPIQIHMIVYRLAWDGHCP